MKKSTLVTIIMSVWSLFCCSMAVVWTNAPVKEGDDKWTPLAFILLFLGCFALVCSNEYGINDK